jgi:hypothetical protein
MERKWYAARSADSQCAWKDSLLTYKKALRKARTAYYTSLIDINKNNLRFLLNTIARLTKSHSSFEPSIPAALSSEDFMSFFTNKITNIREKIDQGRSMTTDELPLLATPPSPDPPLDSFLPIDLPELTSTINGSNPTTCLLDPIPTKLFKDV